MKTKRIVALILLMTVVASVFAGCGPTNNGDVVLQFAIGGIGCADDDLVHAEFNKRLETLLPGVQVEFIFQNSQNFSLWMAAGDPIDIAWSGYEYDIQSEINKKAYMPLDDLINETDTPNIYKERIDYAEDYYSGTYNDKLYLIPIQQPIFTQSATVDIPACLAEYMDIDALLKAAHSSPVTTREVYEILTDFCENVWAADAYDTDIVGNGIDVITMGRVIATRGYDFIGTEKMGGASLCYEAFAKEPVLVNFMETDAYKLFIEYAAKWAEAGYVAEDVLISGGGGTRIAPLSSNASGQWFGTDNPETGEARGVKYVMDQGEVSKYSILLDTLDQQFNGMSSLGSEATYQVIPTTAKYPKEAIKLLDLLRSPVGTPGNDLANLLCYGFEKDSDLAKEYGTYHYTLDGDFAQGVDYTVQPGTNCQYGKCFWTVTNTYLLYRTTAILEGQSEWALDYEKNVKPTLYKTPYYRFRPDTSALLIDISNVSKVVKEYNNQLLCGLNRGNYMNLYNEMMGKLKTANLESVKAAITEQMNAFKLGN